MTIKRMENCSPYYKSWSIERAKILIVDKEVTSIFDMIDKFLCTETFFQAKSNFLCLSYSFTNAVM